MWVRRPPPKLGAKSPPMLRQRYYSKVMDSFKYPQRLITSKAAKLNVAGAGKGGTSAVYPPGGQWGTIPGCRFVAILLDK